MKSPLLRAALAAISLLAGCDRGGTGPAPGAEVTAPRPADSPASPASATPSASVSAPAPSASVPEAVASAVWKGSYKARPGSVTVPKEAHVKTWDKDPGIQGVGEGSLTLRASGTGPARLVKGEGHGALGDLLISGELDGKELHARVDPREPNAAIAMTGVLIGTVGSDGIDAVLRVSGRNGDVVREAEVKLRPE